MAVKLFAFFSLPKHESHRPSIAGHWVWLFPLSQLLHGIEERVEGYGFHIWLRSLSRAPFSTQQTELVHFGFVIAMVIACAFAVKCSTAGWIVVALSTLVLLNAFSHFAGALMSTSAGSGLITSALLWIPLGVFGVMRAWSSISRSRFWLGAAAGAAVQLPITWIAASFAAK